MLETYTGIIALAGFAVAIVLIVRGSVRKNHWGLNLSRIVCPACGAQAPAIRKPASLKQAMWGGWTCSKCGQEVDKWGRIAGKA